MKLSDIHIRDPFILPVTSERRYYLYGTLGAYAWTDSGLGFDAFTFRDFEGRLWLSFHHPNGHPAERPQLLPLSDYILLPAAQI